MEWTLWKCKPDAQYPSNHYVWVNPTGCISFYRSIEPVGFLPNNLPIDIFCGVPISSQKNFKKVFKKVYNHKISQENLSKGWLA
jgi:hypothetical protein